MTSKQKIFIDTNKYLDFYRYKDENMEILNKLSDCNDIIISEQVIDEFERNRNKELHSLLDKANELCKKANENFFNLEPLGIFEKDIKVMNSESRKKIGEIKANIVSFKEKIEEIIGSDNSDIVLNMFHKIVDNPETILYSHDDEVYQKALKRNHLGGVPRSEKSGDRALTICDEYIWETILAKSVYDICFITRDKTYLENKKILAKEYYNRTGKNIVFMETISDGLEYLGNKISDYAKESEQISNLELKEECKEYNKERFELSNKQNEIFEKAICLLKEACETNKKSVMIVNGAPGTGKTFLARHLLSKFVEESYVTTFVTKSASSREVFYQQLKGEGQEKYLRNLLKTSGMFVDSEPNLYDCVIVDDANRLQAKSGLFKNRGENQIKEIINASKFTIFFIDETQRINMDEIGSIDLICDYANKFEAKIEKVDLIEQFRFVQNSKYLNWLDNMLEIRKDEDCNFEFLYDFRVIDNPNELRKLIEEKNKSNNNSRLVAGYCWDWISKGKNDPNVHDIKIPQYDFEMSWNLANTFTWAIDPKSINEVGCIYTCQGVDFDYVGVIIGEDLRYENNHIITDYTKRAKTDQSLKGIAKKMAENPEKAYKIADDIIKNTYRCLMTRGRKGCYVFCVDPNLQQYIKNCLSRMKSN